MHDDFHTINGTIEDIADLWRRVGLRPDDDAEDVAALVTRLDHVWDALCQIARKRKEKEAA